MFNIPTLEKTIIKFKESYLTIYSWVVIINIIIFI